MMKNQLSNKIDQELITQNLFDILDEAFVTHHGVFLDRGTSLFETLETITAAEASIPVGGKCATLRRSSCPCQLLSGSSGRLYFEQRARQCRLGRDLAASQ